MGIAEMNKQNRTPRQNNIVEIRERRTRRKLAEYNPVLRRLEFRRRGRVVHIIHLAKLEQIVDTDANVVYTETDE